jgi:hypothetical protein
VVGAVLRGPRRVGHVQGGVVVGVVVGAVLRGARGVGRHGGVQRRGPLRVRRTHVHVHVRNARVELRLQLMRSVLFINVNFGSLSCVYGVCTSARVGCLECLECARACTLEDSMVSCMYACTYARTHTHINSKDVLPSASMYSYQAVNA